MHQGDLDTENAEFWNELCGSALARSMGITENTPDSLQRFDDAYMTLYPYLVPYVTKEDLVGKKVLEIGLGYGTLGQFIATRACHYYGLDIAAAPAPEVTILTFFRSLSTSLSPLINAAQTQIAVPC